MTSIETTKELQAAMPAVRLRAIEPEDLDELYRIENDMSLWMAGNTNVPYSRQALTDYILTARNDIYADRQLRLMAEDEAGEVVGIADLVNFDPRFRRAEVGIVVKSHARGQGYGKAIMRQLMIYAREILQLRQLYAIVAADNKVCALLMERTGFKRAACLKEWLSTEGKPCDAELFQYFLKKDI